MSDWWTGFALCSVGTAICVPITIAARRMRHPLATPAMILLGLGWLTLLSPWGW